MPDHSTAAAPRQGESQQQDPESPPTGVEERRHYQRIGMEAEVSLYSDSNFYTGFTEDISEGGLFLATYELQPIGTRIELKFTLPDDTVIETPAEVRWVRDPREDDPDVRPGMGLQFTELSQESREAIHEFIAARSPIFYED